MSNFIYIMGKSSTGKDTIYNELKNRIQVNTYIPYTTRPARKGEQNGIDYNFITREQCRMLEEAGKLMEKREYKTINAQGEPDIWTYATILDAQLQKPGDFLTIGTLESYTSIQNYIKEHSKVRLNLIPVYIAINEQERIKRAIKREQMQEKPNYEEIKRRTRADNMDFSEEKLLEARIGQEETFENYDLEECIGNIVKYVNEKRKVTMQDKYKVDVKKVEINKTRNEDKEEMER